MHDYTFLRAREPVAMVSKERWTWPDTYGVEIIEGQDDVTILCAALVIDMILHDESAATSGGAGMHGVP
jgi:uncharacterized protein YxjI